MNESPQLVRLLGEPACIVDGIARRVGGPPRTLALLLFLVLHRHEPLERRRIAFALWPDAGEEEALANLRRHLHALAGALPLRADGAAWFETSRVGVRWTGDAAVDVTALEEALAARDDERAVSLYVGPLCTAIDEAWADLERERLERLVLEALDRLIERDRPRDTQRAIGWALRALAIDRWSESTVRSLIDLHSVAGDAAAARRLYQDYVERLAREYHAVPAPETVQAFERIAGRPGLRAPQSLPDYLPPMLGRERELAQACALLASDRVVTIVGHGGIGKTRLAIAAGKALEERFADGVHLCELVSIADPALVASTIASAAGIAQAGSTDIAATIGTHFGDRLLIIDNCEHVLEETARVVDAILRKAPHARLLATSREPLRLRSESLLRLEPLDAEAAVALFAARGEAANPRFRLSSDVLPVVAEVCRRLDGNALAIELAAARLNVLSVHRIRSQIDTRLELLVNGKRDVVAHQRALRASLDWSYALLDARQQAMFAKLGVFAGIFTLDSALALCSDDSETGVIETLGALVDKSLVVAVPGFDAFAGPRFRLLESVRLYARDQLEAAGVGEATRTRHLATIGAAFEAVRDAYAATPRESLILELAPLLDDARLALDWALRSGPEDLAQGVRLLCATKLWDRLEIGPEALAYAEALLARLGSGSAALEAELWRLISFLDDRGTMSRTTLAGDRSVALAREAGDDDLLAASLAQRAFVAIRFRRFAEAARDLDEAESVAPVTASRRLLLLAGRAFMASLDGRLDEAARGQLAILETHRFLGNRNLERRVTINLAEIEHLRGKTQRALELLRPLTEGLDARTLDPSLRVNRVGYFLATGDLESAREAAAAAVVAFGETDTATIREAMLVGHVALIGAIDGDPRLAAQLGAYVDARYRVLGMTREHTEELVHKKLGAMLDAGLSPADRAAAETEGGSWSRERALYEARRACGAASSGAIAGGLAAVRDLSERRRA
jgi:predicted ATPase/DNA-binding SARP family transcriptional activator